MPSGSCGCAVESYEDKWRRAMMNCRIPIAIYKVELKKLPKNTVIAIGSVDRPAGQDDLDVVKKQMSVFDEKFPTKFLVQAHKPKAGSKIGVLQRKTTLFHEFAEVICGFTPYDLTNNLILIKVGSDEYPASPDNIEFICGMAREFTEGISKSTNILTTHHVFDFRHPKKAKKK